MQTTSKHAQDGTREKGHSPLPPHTEPLPPTASNDLSDMEDSSQQQYNPTASNRGKRAVESPAHSPQKLPSAKKYQWEDIPESAADTPAEHTAPLAAFHASDAPSSENTIKAMLLSLQAGLHYELRSSVSNLTHKIDGIEDRTDHLQSVRSDHKKHMDEMVDAHEEQTDMNYKLKVADLEDRSRRNNLKIRGIPEAVKPQDFIPYLQQIFLKLIPDLTPRDLLI